MIGYYGNNGRHLCQVIHFQAIIEIHVGVVGSGIIFDIVLDELEVNGTPMTFLFDTGAGITVLNAASVDTHNFEISGRSRIGTSGKDIEGITTRNNRISLGNEHIDSLDIDIIHLAHLSEYLNSPLDGIIGVDILSRYSVLRDPVRRSLTLFPTEYTPVDPGWIREPLFLVDGNHFAVDADLLTNTGKMVPVRLKVDSGSDGFLHLFPDSGWREFIRTKKKMKYTGGFGADSTLVNNRKGKIKEMTLAGQTFKNVHTVFVSDAVNLKAVEGSGAQGLVGLGILMKYRILYRYRAREAFFYFIDP